MLHELRASAFAADEAVASNYAGDAQAALLLMRLNAFKYLEEGDPQYVDLFDGRYQEAQEAFAALDREVQDPGRRKMVEAAQAATQAYADGFESLHTDFIRQIQLQAELDTLGPQIRQDASWISTSVSEDFDRQAAATNALVRQTLILLLGLTGLAIIVGVMITLLLAGSISRAARQMVEAARRIADRDLPSLTDTAAAIAVGDLTRSIDLEIQAVAYHSRDEMGQIADAFNQMIARLQETGQSFAHMIEYIQDMGVAATRIADGDLTVDVTPKSEKDDLGNAFAGMIANLRRQAQELIDSVSMLASATQEIATSIAEQASSATEAASAVAETSTSVEEVKQTAVVSNQKSQMVSEVAQESVQISEQGTEAAEAVIEGMEHIQEQMSLIADRIVQLSEQSQAIGEIITTVNGLADQSNLLAVNAAIEAVKAGEQGKGFGVVAQEVRSLAEQSKQATTQVRTILNDIQKAVSAAVMATEQGSKAVAAGQTQVNQAGASIQSLFESVQESAQAATQIAASSQQQLVGLDQVAAAMGSIKQASEQNMDSSRQLDSAAQNLNDLGVKLQELVSRYNL